MPGPVAAFTDTYLPTVNGATYTVRSWRECWEARGGSMHVVYPGSDGHDPEPGEHPLRSLPFPFYDGYRLSLPSVPPAVEDAGVVHAHTPFGVGLGAVRLARRNGAPLVASYHTPTAEYTDYLAPTDRAASVLAGVSRRYERWFFDHADVVTTPSESTKRYLIEDIGVSRPVRVVPNGVDVAFFAPVDPAEFVARYDLPTDRPLVGYTGRHGYEKRIDELIDAAREMEVTLVLGGDGPARPALEERAEAAGVDARFLGFLDRQELPAFYNALDVFAFPSPVETQGLVALEANACGTPVVGANTGALADTVEDGENGYHYPPGDPAAFRAAIEDAIADQDRLREHCLDRRDAVSVDRAVDALEDVYDAVTFGDPGESGF